CGFPQPATKEDPGAKGGQGFSPDGWGVGGWGALHPALCLNAEASIRFLRLKLFSNLAPPGEAPSARARPVRLVDRQFDMAAIRKLQISQTDAETALPAAAALHPAACAAREPAGETVCKGTHEYPPESKITPGNFPAPMSEHRDGSETARQQSQISVNRCGQDSPVPNAYVQRSGPGVQEFQNAARSFRRLMPHAARPSARSRGPRRARFTAFKDRSRCPA